jgi:hypothetical protein
MRWKSAALGLGLDGVVLALEQNRAFQLAGFRQQAQFHVIALELSGVILAGGLLKGIVLGAGGRCGSQHTKKEKGGIVANWCSPTSKQTGVAAWHSSSFTQSQ